jgi:alanyl-tRNA synthetase
MTERLYYTDSYLRQFDADVVDRSEDGTRVSLDRTAFYPTSGGQQFDRGWMNDVPVVEVLEEGERIVHLLGAALGSARITGRIDWERRFDHMQQHTGQHLLSAVIAQLFGHATVSVHFGDEASTLDLDTVSITADHILEAERRANAVVTENRPVRVTFEDADRATGLRKSSERRQGTLRIITIDDLDRSACGGTHVGATGEIGPILIGRVERVKQMVRVEFVCGGRAVRRARRDNDLLTRLSGLLTSAPPELPSLVEALRGDLKRATVERKALEEQLARHRAAELYQGAHDANGRKVIVMRETDGSMDGLRVLGQAIASLPHAVFVAAIHNPPTVLLATAADSGVDAGRVLKAALESQGGRGGGSARLAQGSVATPSVLDAVIRAISA